MKLKPAQQLALYRQLTKSASLSEVQMSYKTKVKPSELECITSSRDSYDILKEVYNDDQIEYVEQFTIQTRARLQSSFEGSERIRVQSIPPLCFHIRVLCRSRRNSK